MSRFSETFAQVTRLLATRDDGTNLAPADEALIEYIHTQIEQQDLKRALDRTATLRSLTQLNMAFAESAAASRSLAVAILKLMQNDRDQTFARIKEAVDRLEKSQNEMATMLEMADRAFE